MGGGNLSKQPIDGSRQSALVGFLADQLGLDHLEMSSPELVGAEAGVRIVRATLVAAASAPDTEASDAPDGARSALSLVGAARPVISAGGTAVVIRMTISDAGPAIAGGATRDDGLPPMGCSALRSVLAALEIGGVPAPRIVAGSDEERVLGAPFLVMTDATGAPPPAGALAEAAAEALGESLARTHCISPSFPGLEELGEPPESPGLDRIAALRRRLDRLSAPEPTVEWVLRSIERRAPRPALELPGHAAPGDVCLCHRALGRPDLAIEGTRLVGLSGWDRAGWGDPAADVGQVTGGILAGDVGCGGARRGFERGYERVAGRLPDPERVQWWAVVGAVERHVGELEVVDRPSADPVDALGRAVAARDLVVRERDLLALIDGAGELPAAGETSSR